MAVIHEEIAPSVLADDVSRVDVYPGMPMSIGSLPGREISPVVFDQIQPPDRSYVRLERRADRRPVHQVAGVPDDMPAPIP
jgi:hypothetical protein